MKRVNAPVPDYSDNDSGEFQYVSTERIVNGDFCEKFSLKKSERVELRKKNKRFLSQSSAQQTTAMLWKA